MIRKPGDPPASRVKAQASSRRRTQEGPDDIVRKLQQRMTCNKKMCRLYSQGASSCQSDSWNICLLNMCRYSSRVQSSNQRNWTFVFHSRRSDIFKQQR
mmetsp:Transcript_8651/g.9515  ORF Transcript_8651/g.9515 Transcript_8651/m.9515 type:complete len:99 (-) Transcript_8651:693-989(-)